MQFIQDNPQLGLILLAALCLCTLGAGFWLALLGRPLNTPVFTIHKLLTIGMGVLLYFLVRPRFGQLTGDTATLTCTILASIGLLGLLVSGALLSLDVLPRTIMLRVHNLATALYAGGGGVAAWLLSRIA